MGIELPGPLMMYMSVHNIDWPEGDETACWDYGSQWSAMGGTLQGFAEEARGMSSSLAGQNRGIAVDAFSKSFNGNAKAGVVPIAGGMAQGYNLVGGAMYIMGAAILAFKIAAIAQLVIQMINELTAIAEAPATFGASLAQIPIVRAIIGSILEMLQEKAINQVLAG